LNDERVDVLADVVLAQFGANVRTGCVATGQQKTQHDRSQNAHRHPQAVPIQSQLFIEINSTFSQPVRRSNRLLSS
jgi:hypothetical protein